MMHLIVYIFFSGPNTDFMGNLVKPKMQIQVSTLNMGEYSYILNLLWQVKYTKQNDIPLVINESIP